MHNQPWEWARWPTEDFACIRGPTPPPILQGGEGRNGGRAHAATANHGSAADGWAAATAKHDGASQQRHGAAQQAALEQRGRTTWSDTPIPLAPLVRCYIGGPVVTGDMATAVTTWVTD